MVNVLLRNKGTLCKMTHNVSNYNVNIKKVPNKFTRTYFHNASQISLPRQMLYSCDVNNVHANKLSMTSRAKYITPPSKSLDLLVACLSSVDQYLSQ